MTWYSFLLFVHVSMAAIWVGGGLMMQFFALRTKMSGEPARMAALGEDIEWIANRVFIPGSLLAFLTGVLLVIESDFYGFGDDWIVIGLVLYATSFFSGILFLGPESGRIGKLTAEGSPQAGPRMARLVFLARLELILLFGLIDAWKGANAINQRFLGGAPIEEEKVSESPAWGITLVVMGIVFLAHNLGWLDFDKLARFWPLLLIAAGAFFINGSIRKRKAEESVSGDTRL